MAFCAQYIVCLTCANSRIKSHDPSHKVSELTPKCLLHPVLDGPTSANETLPAATGASYIARRGTGFGGKKWMLKTNIKMAEQHVEFCQLEARSKLKRPLSSSSLIFCNPLKLEWTFVIFEVIQLICCIGAHCKKNNATIIKHTATYAFNWIFIRILSFRNGKVLRGDAKLLGNELLELQAGPQRITEYNHEVATEGYNDIEWYIYI